MNEEKISVILTPDTFRLYHCTAAVFMAPFMKTRKSYILALKPKHYKYIRYK